MAKKSSAATTTTTAGKAAAPDIIRQLVEKFAEHRETYRRTAYNETQLRQDFLDPFFVALGWDVYNTQGFAEAYRDVILEQGLVVEQSVRAPDYCFRIGGTAKFRALGGGDQNRGGSDEVRRKVEDRKAA
jgi:hypothetical protein